MSAYKKRQKMLALTRVMADAGAGIGSNGPMGNFAGNMGQIASNMAQAEAESEAQKEAEEKEKSGFFGKIGGLLGGTLLSATPLGPVVGGALGSALGSAGGQAAGGGGVDVGQVLGAGISGGMGGYMGNKALEASQVPLDQNTEAMTAPLTGDIAGAAKAATTPSFGDRAYANLRGSLYANELLDPNRPASMSFMPQQGYGQQPYDPFQYLRPIR
ncbi:MAG TPA: hypothetical protein PL005_13165 [Candidatus Hydrogenedentes bacterium]|nr:hypothetical protein [Candidatus Hydrogenedentota bacterium]